MDGIVIINKEKGCTSNDVVKKVKKILNEKVGHTGTLDPNATGVLPLLIGKGTKLSKYLINHDKEYEAILQLGIKTTTADEEGQVIETTFIDENILSDENVSKSLNSFIGKIKQMPPIYSAIKVNGKKLYQYAREGKDVKIDSREIEIYDIKLIDINSKEKQIKFYVKCSKGTYIRTLCENIAEKLNTIGYMKELKRLSVGDFKIDNAITISKFENEILDNDYSNILTIEDFFKTYPEYNISSEKDLNNFLNGVKLNNNSVEEFFRVYYSNKFIGIAKNDNRKNY